MPKRYWYVILTYILTQLSSFPAALIAYNYFSDNYTEVVIYWSIFSFLVALIISLWLLKPDMQMPLHRDASSSSHVIIWAIAGFFMAYIVQVVASLIEIKVLGIEAGSQNTQNIMGITRAIPLFMIVPAIIAPVLEEVIFRKIIFGSLYKRMNFFFAAFLSALIFGAIHGELQHLLVYTSMGFVFAYLYVKTKRILTPILVHAALNTMTVIAQYSMTPEEIQKQLEQLQMILFGG
ncbi:CPBP family intramembrane glutamic endopeptidase [Oceanobacillus halophilus]|uniref:CPBP family intramembrane metalloprotease n=1 Tax=Oceanobacillus halophilus TaxID=930130 RepID=A0A494ZRJ1_9BACI|nr:type II CAAX endopeptidase family protein [Oceanobacillus halophilus]RKQ28332.1 CPBP family intramembrane metalloprotease [Oceanobacillus halophilus]